MRSGALGPWAVDLSPVDGAAVFELPDDAMPKPNWIWRVDIDNWVDTGPSGAVE